MLVMTNTIMIQNPALGVVLSVEPWQEDILASGSGERRRVPRDFIGIGTGDYGH